MLLSVSYCDVNVSDVDYVTPLIMAAMDGDCSICELLVSPSNDNWFTNHLRLHAVNLRWFSVLDYVLHS